MTTIYEIDLYSYLSYLRGDECINAIINVFVLRMLRSNTGAETPVDTRLIQVIRVAVMTLQGLFE